MLAGDYRRGPASAQRRNRGVGSGPGRRRFIMFHAMKNVSGPIRRTAPTECRCAGRRERCARSPAHQPRAIDANDPQISTASENKPGIDPRPRGGNLRGSRARPASTMPASPPYRLVTDIALIARPSQSWRTDPRCRADPGSRHRSWRRHRHRLSSGETTISFDIRWRSPKPSANPGRPRDQPGRSIVGNAGLLVATVINVRPASAGNCRSSTRR